jgi:hypothetical protein
MNTNFTSIAMALNEADTQIKAGWEDFKNNDNDAVQARLDMVSTFIKSAEKSLATYQKEQEKLHADVDQADDVAETSSVVTTPNVKVEPVTETN